MSSPRSAFIDVGTNSILCLIAELRDGGRFRVLEDLAEITRLGEDVGRSGMIAAQGERRSSQVLRRYVDLCERLGVREIFAVGTSALRDAANGSSVTQKWRDELGLDVRVISGEEEAAYSFAAVQNGLSLSGRELLVIDVGGGSTELIRGNDRGVSRCASIDLGSVRLTERFLRSDPVHSAELDEMNAAISAELAALRARWPQLGDPSSWVGIAGTFTTLAAVEKELSRYSHDAVHGSTLTVGEVRRQVRLFQSRTLEERKTIVGLAPGRADVILAGACLIERIMSLLGASEVIVSDQGVRYGLLYERSRRA